MKPTLLRVREGVLTEDGNQRESSLHPHQAMAHQCKFSLTPMGYLGASNAPGEPKMIVEDVEIPFLFDGRKALQHTRKPAAEELENLQEVDIVPPTPHGPSSKVFSQPKRKKAKKARSKIPIEEWRKRLALAPDETMSHDLDNSTQLAIGVESDNRSVSRRHCKSRFPFFKYPRLNDEFHTDSFFPSARLAQNCTCAQAFAGKGAGRWEVCPMSRESHSLRSLQDFVRTSDVPPTLKRDNART